MYVFTEPFNFSFFSVTLQGIIDLGYHYIEWFALEMNRDHSIIFEIASNYYILESFVDYDGYYISSGNVVTPVLLAQTNLSSYLISEFFLESSVVI